MTKYSSIHLEKMNNTPGIYIIFNMKTYRLYVGKSKHLKQRALEHIKNLYSGQDNNKELQEEFSANTNTYYIGCLQELDSSEELDYFESLYYSAAQKWFNNKDMIYNIRQLDGKFSFSTSELNYAQSIISNAIINYKKSTDKYTYNRVIEENKLKDFISSDILSKSKSLKELYDNNELDFLMFGIAGDYVGDKSPQTIESILNEKTDYIKKHKKCLWVTSGPSLDVFNNYLSLFKSKYGDNKILYVLFKLTAHKYNSKNNEKSYIMYEDQNIYECTSPKKRTVKALVIKKFYNVEEDFNFEQFQNYYYKYNMPRKLKLSNKYELYSQNPGSTTLYPAILMTSIENQANKDIRDSLHFTENPYLLEEIKKRMPSTSDFPPCNENEHPTYYILAEVENYVSLQPKPQEKKC